MHMEGSGEKRSLLSQWLNLQLT